MNTPGRFSTEWAFDPFKDHPSFRSKRMFGGLAAYLMERMVMVLAESPGETSYRGKDYHFEIWNGIMFPTEQTHHASLIGEFPGLRPHPVLGKWLYLPAERDDFEASAIELGTLIAKLDRRLGVLPKPKRKKGSP